VTDSTSSPRTLRGRRESAGPVRAPRPPRRLRVARVAELACLPVFALTLFSLPLPRHASEVAAVAVIVAECVATTAISVGFVNRRRWAAIVALVLAAWLLYGSVMRLPPLLPALGGFGRFAFLAALISGAWMLLMQLVVVLALLSPRLWRDELH
jgi:hypothetical protein